MSLSLSLSHQVLTTSRLSQATKRWVYNSKLCTKKSKTYLDDLSSTFVAIKIYEKHDNDNNNDDVDNGAKVNSKLGLGTSTAPGLRFRHLGKSGLKVGTPRFLYSSGAMTVLMVMMMVVMMMMTVRRRQVRTKVGLSEPSSPLFHCLSCCHLS